MDICCGIGYGWIYVIGIIVALVMGTISLSRSGEQECGGRDRLIECTLVMVFLSFFSWLTVLVYVLWMIISKDLKE